MHCRNAFVILPSASSSDILTKCPANQWINSGTLELIKAVLFRKSRVVTMILRGNCTSLRDQRNSVRRLRLTLAVFGCVSANLVFERWYHLFWIPQVPPGTFCEPQYLQVRIFWSHSPIRMVSNLYFQVDICTHLLKIGTRFSHKQWQWSTSRSLLASELQANAFVRTDR